MFHRGQPTLLVNVRTSTTSSALRRAVIRSSSREDALRRARRVQIILAVFGLSILKLLSSAFFSRPQVTTLFIMWLFGVVFFVSTEASGILHASQKTENKFWMGMASMLSTILLFLADDSPFRVPSSRRGMLVGVITVTMSTYAVHVMHKRSHRRSLENRSSIPKNKSYREAISTLAKEPTARNLVGEVNESLEKLESSLIPGGFRRIFDKSALLANERKVIDCFRDASRAELNHLVLHVNMNVVLYRLKNHSNRKKVVGRKSTGADSSLSESMNDVLTSSATFQKEALTSSETAVASSGVSNPATTVLLVAGALPKQAYSGTAATSAKKKSLDQRLFGGLDESEEEEEESDMKEEDTSPLTTALPFSTKLAKSSSSAPNPVYYDEETLESDLEKKNHRNALVELLAKDRLGDLTTSARASILDAIQVIGMMRNPLTKDRAQRWASRIILDTRGDQLSELKTITDAKGSVHSMHKLVYNDITCEAIRATLLSHFQLNKRSKLGRKVLSDVDDTLLSSGGAYPAGIDDSYPHHAIYPGAGAFYEGLDRGVSETFNAPTFYGSKVDVDTDSEGEDDFFIGGIPSSSNSDTRRSKPSSTGVVRKKRVVVGNLVFLSARPHVYKDMAERRVYFKFERMIHAKNLHAMPTLLPGDLESGQAYMLRGDFEPMARKKLKNMVEYHSIYPEFTHVFVCDNGQADVRAAELMKERLGASLEAVYVHQVQPIDKTFGYTEASYEKWHKMGIIFYKTFVGAATDACRKNLIDPTALRQVCLNAAKEFFELSSLFGSKFPGGLYGIEERRIELVTDFVKANELLELRGYQTVQPPRALCLFPVGSTVHTRYFGEGFVRAFRPGDGVYEIALLGDKLIGHFTALDLRQSTWGRTASGLFLGSSSSNGTSHVHDDTSIQVGCKVSTPYGEGVVRRYRPSDQMFEVILTRWPALAFVREGSVEPLTVAGRPNTTRRILGLGQALIRRTFSSAKSSSPTLKPSSSSTTTTAVPLTLSSNTTPHSSPTQQKLTINVSAPPSVPVTVVLVNNNNIKAGHKVTVSPFGPAVVLAEPRAEDSVVHVKFESFQAEGFVQLASVRPMETPNAAGSRRGAALSSFSFPVKDAAVRVLSMFRGSTSSNHEQSSTPQVSAATTKGSPIMVSSRVETPYGTGAVVDLDRGDGIVKVRLDWGADAYVNSSSISSVTTELEQQEPSSSTGGGVTSRILSLLVSPSRKAVLESGAPSSFTTSPELKPSPVNGEDGDGMSLQETQPPDAGVVVENEPTNDVSEPSDPKEYTMELL